MISHFFINRPIFASVISLIITFGGLVAGFFLPIEQFPNITPPQVQISTNFQGASAEVVADAIAAPLEQQINAVENMIYMYSQSSSTGDLAISTFFDIGASIEQAQIDVQNAVNLALPQLPAEVVQTGVSVYKQTPAFLLIAAMQSPDGRFDDLYISNYATVNVVNELQRIPGVSQVNIIGPRDYAMRVWLRPDLMAQMSITVQDITTAIRDQNQQFASGQLGQSPNPRPVEMTIPVVTLGRLNDPKQFEEIIVRANLDGSLVRLKDVGRVELGAQNYDVIGEVNNLGATLIAIYQEYGANALNIAEQTYATMKRLSKSFPAGIEYSIPYDTTRFVKISIQEVIKTLFEAAVLVALVVLVFLQSFRATLIPVLAMVVSIVGTLAGMYLFGFSLNTLTLFGMVLAIGIVVDDAIVVVENVDRNIREHRLQPKEAAMRAMTEVTGPVIAIAFVLTAVFVPVAFLGGIAGQLYKQFALTISISVIISAIVALTLSPALAAIILKPPTNDSWFTKGFNNVFGKITHGYEKGASWLVRHRAIGCIIFFIVIGALLLFFKYTPSSFVPNEDQGYFIVISNLPDGASLGRTEAVAKKIYDITMKNPAIEGIVSLTGFSLLDNINRTNIGSYFPIMIDWDKRKAPDMQAAGLISSIGQQYSEEISEAQVFAFSPPAIQGLGTVGGFEFWVESRGSGGLQDMADVLNTFMDKANARPELTALNLSFESENMQLFVDLDRAKTSSMSVKVSDVFQTLQAFLGSLFVNNFNKFGRVWDVMLQAEPKYRQTIDDIGEVYVRSSTQQMIPLKALLKTEFTKGANIISHFNGFLAAKITGNASEGYSSGQAMDAMAAVAKEVLPQDYAFAWGGESYQEQSTGGTSNAVLLAGLLMVFLVLSALYERWSLPIVVILATPFGLLGAFVAIWLKDMSNDIYFQVGLVTLIALSAKNAILIVEFATIKRAEGKGVIEAALEAARLRFRAIIMTSLTFILGVVPLVTSTGAGAASRHSVGTGVMGGMISAVLLAIFFVPLFFRIIEERSTKNRINKTAESPPAETPPKEP